MNKNEAKNIADVTQNEDLKTMFQNAQKSISDWGKISRVNKGMTIGFSFNLFTKGLKTDEDFKKIHGLAKLNMIWEFGEFLPNYKKRIKYKYKKVQALNVAHQEPIFI